MIAPPSPQVTSPKANQDAALQLLRALSVVALLAGWNVTSSVIARRFHVGSLSWSSPHRLGFEALGIAVYLGVVWLGCVVLGKTSLRSLGWRFDAPLQLIALGLVLELLLVALVFIAYLGLAGTQGVSALATAIVTMSLDGRIKFLVLGAKVAFVEETLFRGDLLQHLSRHVQPAVAVLLSSVVFAFYHRTLSVVPLTMKCIFGVVFCAFTLRSRSLLPSTIGHTLLWVIIGDN